MKESKITIIKDIASHYMQFSSSSLAFLAVSEVLNISLHDARKLVSTHCNILSLWLILKASGNYDRSYKDYFAWLLKNNFCDKKGFTLVAKEIILKKLGIESELNRTEEFEDILDPMRLNDEHFYQLRIKSKTPGGTHFLAGYIQNGVFKICDTSERGIGVDAVDHINEENFLWAMEVC